MSTYDNETKIYPDLKPTAPQEPQSYRLNKLSEIEVFFLDEIGVREQIAKKMKRFNTITGIIDTDLITSTVIVRGIFFFAQTKLDSIANIIWQAMQDGNISPTEFQKVMQKVRARPGQSKTDHKRTARRNTWTEKTRRQRRFFTKNRKFFRYAGCQCHLKYEAPPPYGMWFYGP